MKVRTTDLQLKAVLACLPTPEEEAQLMARRVLKGGTVHITMVFTRGELGGPSCGSLV